MGTQNSGDSLLENPGRKICIKKIVRQKYPQVFKSENVVEKILDKFSKLEGGTNYLNSRSVVSGVIKRGLRVIFCSLLSRSSNTNDLALLRQSPVGVRKKIVLS